MRATFVGVVLCLGALACSDELSPREAIVVGGLGEQMLQWADTTTFSITVQNRSKETQYLEYSPCEALFEIVDRETGEVVAPNTRVCADPIQQVKVGPLGTINTATTWFGDRVPVPCSGAPGCGLPNPWYLDVGFYLLRPRIKVAGAGWVYGPSTLLGIYPR